MTETERKLAVDIVSRELAYFWNDTELMVIGDKGGFLGWVKNFSFEDCARVLYPSRLVEIMIKLLGYGLSFEESVRVIAFTSWKRRQEILDAQKEDEA